MVASITSVIARSVYWSEHISGMGICMLRLSSTSLLIQSQNEWRELKQEASSPFNIITSLCTASAHITIYPTPSYRFWLENSLCQERTHTKCFSHSKCSERLASHWKFRCYETAGLFSFRLITYQICYYDNTTLYCSCIRSQFTTQCTQTSVMMVACDMHAVR